MRELVGKTQLILKRFTEPFESTNTSRRVCKLVIKMWIIVQKSEGLEMYMLELYQIPSYKDLVAFGSLKEGKEFVSKITGYTLENEDDFVQGNKVEITNIYMKGLE